MVAPNTIENPASTSVTLVDLTGATAGTVVIQTKVTGDTQQRFTITADGTQSWGPGNAAADVILARTGVGVAQLTGAFTVTGIGQFSRLGVGVAVAGAEIFAVTGTGTVPSGASAVWNAEHHNVATATITGSTNITTAGGFNYAAYEIPLITASSAAVVITAASTLTVKGAPTASAVGGFTPVLTASYAFWVQTGISRFGGALYANNGTSAAPSYSATSFPGSGMSFTTGYVGIGVGGIAYVGITASALYVGGVTAIGFGPGSDTVTAAPDTTLVRVAIRVLGLQNAANAMTFRIYGNGTKYLTMSHDGTNAVIDTESTTGGLKITAATTQKFAFHGVTPIAQGASVADATGGATIDAEARTAINAVISRLEDKGLIATV